MWCGHQVYRPLGKISASLLWPIRPLPSGSGFPHQPRLTFGCSCSKGPCFFLPMVLCTCWSICLKCFPLTLYLASAISFIGPHPAQMFLPQGSSSSFLAWVSCVWCAPASTAPSHCLYSFYFHCWDVHTPFENRDPVCCVHCQATGT